MENSNNREKRIESIKRGGISNKLLIGWLRDDEGLKDEIIQKGIKTIDEIEVLLKLPPEEHRVIYSQGRYNLEDIKRIKRNNELPLEECDRMIYETILKLVDNGKMNLDDIRSSEDLNNYNKGELIADVHKKNISQNKYSLEKIEALIANDELTGEDIKQVVSPETYLKIVPEPLKVDFLKWKDVPPLMEDRTDIYVLGVPGSGKSTLMSGLLYYAHDNEKLSWAIKNNPNGAKYLQQLIRAVRTRRLIEATSQDVIQYMACEFIDEEKYIYPLTFIEMSGEIFKEFYSADGIEIPERMKEYITADNHKLLLLIIDYEEEHDIKPDESADQLSQLEFTLQVLDEQGTLAKTDAILIIITKWDLCKNGQGTREDAGKFLKDKGYSALKVLCEGYKHKYGLEFTFETFSLGKFYGLHNKKYEFKETDSKRLFNWFCDQSAHLSERKPSASNNGKKNRWTKLFGK